MLRPHPLQSGNLFSIGKDLNFIVVFDKHNESTKQGNAHQQLGAAAMASMFNENQEYRADTEQQPVKPSIASMNAVPANSISINFIENLMGKQHDSCSLMSQATVKR